MTNSDLLKIFNEKYPELKNIDYRPLCPVMYTNDLVGITIWLDNGDVIQYYPKEAQEERKE